MIALVAVLAGTAVASVLGWTWHRGTGVVRPGTGERVAPADVGLPEGSFGEAATLLLLTSQQDPRTDPVRRALEDLVEPGVRLAEVDLTVRGELAGRYAVTRTPSLLVLDGERRFRTRVKGPATPEVLTDALRRARHAG